MHTDQSRELSTIDTTCGSGHFLLGGSHRVTDRVGWHGRAYVRPGETLGDDSGERIVFQGEIPTAARFGTRGKLAQWRERVAVPCVSTATKAASRCFDDWIKAHQDTQWSTQ